MNNLLQDLTFIVYSYLFFEEALHTLKILNIEVSLRDKFIKSQKPLIPSINESLEKGYFETLKYLIGDNITIIIHYQIIYNAIKYGHLEIFKYFRKIEHKYQRICCAYSY